MTQFQKISLFLLRISLGWLMFYAGITKILDPNWSAAGYLKNAQTFSAFFNSLTAPSLLPTINFVNEWGLTLLGLSLLLGIFIKYSAPLGALLMLLYYFPMLNFPMAGEHSYLVDEHIIYALALLLLGAFNAGKYWGLSAKNPQWR